MAVLSDRDEESPPQRDARARGKDGGLELYRSVPLFALALLPSCSGCYGASSSPLRATLVDVRFDVAEHMQAALEMQRSGEPFAQLLGYNLSNFSRTLALTDQYLDPATNRWITDPLGYALAIESYEYSKQPMNNLSFESGAGLSLMFGPVLNPAQLTGDPAYALLRDRFQQLASEAFATGPTSASLVVKPAPVGNPLNSFGWPGLWPVFAEFESFDPSIAPDTGTVPTCTFGGTASAGAFGYGGAGQGTGLVANYECDYNSLNLPARDAQVTKVLSPAALGYATWKQGLWVINYWQTMQDTAGNGIVSVAPADIEQVGQAGNTVVGRYSDPSDPTGQALLPGAPGVYLGDIPMEGWQGLTMIEEIDNKAALLLGSLLSEDGSRLTGATSVTGGVSSVTAAADDYGYDSPLLYFPAGVAVTEEATAPSPDFATKYFPRPSDFSIGDASSRLADLSALAGGFAEAFAFTDASNSQVGGSVPFLATFDGDPFPGDDGSPDGESTLHDRTLGVVKIALVDLDRLHWNAGAKVLVDAADVQGGSVIEGTSVTTTTLAATILALRNAYRGLNGTLQLYSNDTPDTLGVPSALDSNPLGGAPYSGTLASHVLELLRAEADFLTTNLVDSHGAVANGYDLASSSVDPSPTLLESETSALLALLEAYLATSEQSYRTAAESVYADLDARFWMEDLRLYRTTAGQDDRMAYTPLRFGMLQGALRQYYKLVASGPGHAAEGAELLQRIARLYKLVLNGWDDFNQDGVIQYPDECLWGGLEMGERALTGELGHPVDQGDRDHDCIREISKVGLPAALGEELDLERR